MNSRHLIVLGTIAILGWGPTWSQGQATAQPDDVAVALEFQTLLEEYILLPRAPLRATEQQISEWRASLAPQLDGLISRLENLASRAGRPPDVLLIQALCHARRANLFLAQRRDLDAQFTKAPSPEVAAARSEQADKVAQEYERIDTVLREALTTAEALRNRREVSLVHGVVLAQGAIVRDFAVDAAEDADRPVSVDLQVISALLDEAEELLQKYMAATGPERGLEWVRGQFYLGVVEYRRALKPRVVGQQYFTEVDSEREEARKAFAHAGEIFTRLSDADALLKIIQPDDDPDRVAQRAFRSSSFFLEGNYSAEMVARYYAASANLYLGLIAAIDKQYGEDHDARLKAVGDVLGRAKDLDAYRAEPEEEPFSLTDGTIPVSYDKVMGELEEAAKVVGRPEPYNDLTLTFGLTPIYDTNVLLLGRNTAAPLDKNRRRDFRVASMVKMNYLADLDVLDKDNEFLQKWQVLGEVRVAPTWNARIHDFNEQIYGGTLNLRYELLGADVCPSLDGVFVHARYDYDYVLLGNDGFLRLNRVRPSVQVVAFDQLLDTSVFFNYEDRNYLEVLSDERFDRDGDYFAAGFDTRLDLGRWVNAEGLWGADKVWGPWAPNEDDPDFERPLEVYFGLEFTTNSTQGSEFDYSSQIFSAGAVMPLPYGIDFSAGAVFEWEDYRGNSLVDRRRRGRNDFIQEYGFRAERRFYLTDYDREFEHIHPLKLNRVVMTLFGDLRFTIDDSNVRDRLGQSIFEYNRIMYSAGVRFDIN